MNATWQALAREAGLSAEQLAIGVSAIDKANYSHHAYYGQMFFSLSIGFERAAKLALVVDFAVENNGKFLPNNELRHYGHDLKKLLLGVDEIALRRGLNKRLPNAKVHNGIIETLTKFSANITRYYNLDIVTGKDDENIKDPISEWFDRVTTPILDSHYKPHHRKKHQFNAALIEEFAGEFMIVRHHSEQGEPLNSAIEASMQTAITEFAKPYERMYTMQIIRFVGGVLSELGLEAQRMRSDDIPYLSEFFAIFNNDDDYFKSRKTWSIY